jgi:hypothetical protein
LIDIYSFAAAADTDLMKAIYCWQVIVWLPSCQLFPTELLAPYQDNKVYNLMVKVMAYCNTI